MAALDKAEKKLSMAREELTKAEAVLQFTTTQEALASRFRFDASQATVTHEHKDGEWLVCILLRTCSCYCVHDRMKLVVDLAYPGVLNLCADSSGWKGRTKANPASASFVVVIVVECCQILTCCFRWSCTALERVFVPYVTTYGTVWYCVFHLMHAVMVHTPEHDSV